MDRAPVLPEPRISRRRFGQCAFASTTALLSPSAATDFLHKRAGQSTSLPGLSAEQSEEVEAKLANIVRKYGDRLTQEQRQHLRRILIYNQRMLASVRAFSVQNGDSPASVLRVCFAEPETR